MIGLMAVGKFDLQGNMMAETMSINLFDDNNSLRYLIDSFKYKDTITSFSLKNNELFVEYTHMSEDVPS